MRIDAKSSLTPALSQRERENATLPCRRPFWVSQGARRIDQALDRTADGKEPAEPLFSLSHPMGEGRGEGDPLLTAIASPAS
jgi:hypothetical protein